MLNLFNKHKNNLYMGFVFIIVLCAESFVNLLQGAL